ncbi:hypothetical protein O6H91_10G037800 [Diphasiastrum complanatum]|uniref:Uncharacterized protein n=1 Tax=Diphasiastrum complanatum TaxID=34168 RepID=A0ACC2CG61_DIPCM|nr:hypothetical protein O6H91_10G037800 [Diphasiastrum complanatum]
MPVCIQIVFKELLFDADLLLEVRRKQRAVITKLDLSASRLWCNSPFWPSHTVMRLMDKHKIMRSVVEARRN